MLVLVLQSALMLAITFIAGCFIGWFLKGLMRGRSENVKIRSDNSRASD